MKIGLATCKTVAVLTESEQKLIPFFKKKDVFAEAAVWNDATINWTLYDYLIIRSVWDYHLNIAAFSKWLNYIEDKGIKTLNSAGVIRSNQHKFYLKSLQAKGVAIVPTIFIDKTKNLDLSPVRDTGWQQAVIKPAISASSFLTETFAQDELEKIENTYKTVALERDLLIQQFMPEVQDFGELSILFFNRKYSHSVLKTAKENEFRVQSEFGGTTKSYKPDDSIIKTASEILSQFKGPILYARVDGIIKDGKFILMEIELIEPDLFFEYDKMSLERFVEATMEIISQ